VLALYRNSPYAPYLRAPIGLSLSSSTPLFPSLIPGHFRAQQLQQPLLLSPHLPLPSYCPLPNPIPRHRPPTRPQSLPGFSCNHTNSSTYAESVALGPALLSGRVLHESGQLKTAMVPLSCNRHARQKTRYTCNRHTRQKTRAQDRGDRVARVVKT
jgi:hypothetical protein